MTRKLDGVGAGGGWEKVGVRRKKGVAWCGGGGGAWGGWVGCGGSAVERDGGVGGLPIIMYHA